MKQQAILLPARPFFLKTGDGERFCLYHAPHPGQPCRGSFLYVHPFCDEMNKSRRMAALQARRLAALGFGVLQIDLFGCGDSSGEFRDASWERWHDDLALAKTWLDNHTRAPVHLWGLRLGALLALDFASRRGGDGGHLILWQPIVSGASFLNQFLRMRLANEMLASGKGTGIQAMRTAFMAGETQEIAGYELPAGLATAIDRLHAAELRVVQCPIHWFEIVPAAGRPMPPAAAQVVHTWHQAGVEVQVHEVPGAAFWATQEITECPGLVTRFSQLYEAAPIVSEHAMPDAKSSVAAYATPPTRDVEQRPVHFRCHDSWLYGMLSVPQKIAEKGVLIVVGGPQYRVGSHRQFTLLSNYLAANGIAVMRFDYRGMGDSDGDIRTFEEIGDDLRAAIDRFFEEFPALTNLVIWGLCDAASAALFYAHQDRRVTGLVLLNPWIRTEQGAAKAYLKHYYLARLFAPDFWHKLASGRFDWVTTMRSLTQFVAQTKPAKTTPPAMVGNNPTPLPQRLLDGFTRFKGHTLFILSGDDLTAQEFTDVVQHSRSWQKRLRQPQVQWLALAEANHTFSRRQWRDTVALWTRDWLRSW